MCALKKGWHALISKRFKCIIRKQSDVAKRGEGGWPLEQGGKADSETQIDQRYGKPVISDRPHKVRMGQKRNVCQNQDYKDSDVEDLSPEYMLRQVIFWKYADHYQGKSRSESKNLGAN